MIVPPAALTDTTEPLDEPASQPLRAAPADAAPAEVLITPQQVHFGTVAAVGLRRERTDSRLAAVVRRVFATTSAPRPRTRHYPKRLGYIENAAMARAMENL
jgi:hypothetical protein